MSSIMLERSGIVKHFFYSPPIIQKPYIPSQPFPQNGRRARAMTIIAGFCCTDGVVICADRLITRGEHKYYEEKIHVVDAPDYALVVAGAGEPGLIKEIFEKISGNLATNSSPLAVKDIADGVLTGMGRLEAQEFLPIELLIAASSSKHQAELFLFNGKGLHKVPEYAFGGVGDSSLVRFLCENLYYDGITTGGARVLGTYIVSKAKNYVTGVGGPIDMYVVYPDGGCKRVGINETARVAQQLEENECRILPLLLVI